MLEIELSILDQAVQGLAIATRGSIRIYDHDEPVRWVEFEGEDGVYRRVSIFPGWNEDLGVQTRLFFRMVIDAWKDCDKRRASWHKLGEPFAVLPKEFSVQFKLLRDAWSEIEKVTLTDLGTVCLNPSRIQGL